ncbi:abnormal pharyngeal pumping eat-20 [Ditylenchus destructor]|uniref:Abnormal pharyngeal pumping eat-20 n=1 Tax=Ditylenchus destructor TaxID=166010 RepID=A0AAD4MSP9_9BILA|nr:abnormal pharyngeal pumping eat-20 [Ditylenchus destructor]
MSQRRFWSFSIISALYILAFAHPIVPLSAQSGNDKPQTAESNPKEVRRKPTNLELGMPVAFPMFRPAALASAGPVTVTTESTTAEESEEHMEFVPLPSTVRSGSAPFVPVAAQNPTEPVEQWSMGRVTRRPNEPFETTTPRDKAAVYDPCLTFGCKNNGSCDVKENFKPFCVCQQGFSGERCEVDMCSDLFCHHLVETCRIRNGHPVCECADGQAGERCRQKVGFLC